MIAAGCYSWSELASLYTQISLYATTKRPKGNHASFLFHPCRSCLPCRRHWGGTYKYSALFPNLCSATAVKTTNVSFYCPTRKKISIDEQDMNSHQLASVLTAVLLIFQSIRNSRGRKNMARNPDPTRRYNRQPLAVESHCKVLEVQLCSRKCCIKYRCIYLCIYNANCQISRRIGSKL